jgi:hypothetical protein
MCCAGSSREGDIDKGKRSIHSRRKAAKLSADAMLCTADESHAE